MAAYVTILPSKERTASVDSPAITVWEKYQAAHIAIDINSGSGFNLVFDVRGKDTASGKSYSLLTTGTIAASGLSILKIGPDYTSAANIAKDYMPYSFYVAVTASGSTSATYSVAASLI